MIRIKYLLFIFLAFLLYSCREDEGNITFLKFNVGNKEYRAIAYLGSFDQGNKASLLDTTSTIRKSLDGYIDLEDYLTYKILLSNDLQAVRAITFYGINFNGGFCCEDGFIQNSNGTSVSLNITQNDNYKDGYIAGTFSGVVKKINYGGFSYASYCDGSFLPVNGSFRLKIGS